jgi:hypothetical protein
VAKSGGKVLLTNHAPAQSALPNDTAGELAGSFYTARMLSDER